jgi:aspartyl-tRNA(Asn)/glutamyl-tRNA(Gln) amidotransferase subunit A
MSWHTKTIAELSKSLHSKEVSSQELANYFLTRIDQSKELNAFVDVNIEQTLLQAKAADAAIVRWLCNYFDRCAIGA